MTTHKHNHNTTVEEEHKNKNLSLDSSFVSVANVDDGDRTPSLASSTYSASDVDSPLMTKSSIPLKQTTATASSSTPSSKNGRSRIPSTSSFTHKHEWPNGKRPRGFRTAEGKEAAEKSKNYKTGVSIPHLSSRCNTYEGVLKHAILGAIRK